MKILIIIPAYNEEQAIVATINSLSQIDADILVVNDGSLDRTGALINEQALTNLRLSTVHLPVNSGIGVTMQTGFIYALRNNYDYAIQFDGDGQHDADSIPPLLNHTIQNKLDLCIGSRYLDMDSEGFKSTPMRRLGIMFFSKFIMLLTGGKIKDTTSGFRVYSTKVISFFSKSYPSDYPEPESVSWCFRNKLRVGEYSVKMNERQGGVSSINHVKSAYYMIKVGSAIVIDRIRRKEV